MSVICILLVNSHLLFNVTEKVILEAGCLSDISDPSVFITKYPQGYSVTQGREDRTAHEEKNIMFSRTSRRSIISNREYYVMI